MLQKSKFSNNILNTNIVKPLMNFQKNKKVCDYLKGPSQTEAMSLRGDIDHVVRNELAES